MATSYIWYFFLIYILGLAILVAAVVAAILVSKKEVGTMIHNNKKVWAGCTIIAMTISEVILQNLFPQTTGVLEKSYLACIAFSLICILFSKRKE